MYLEHYGLSEAPFSITPDPRFVFLSERHRDALAHLLFGIGQGGGGGFVQLTGEVGTGKTTLCRVLLEQLPDRARVALVLNPRQTPVELLETICEELHVDIAGRRGSTKALVDALNAYLLDAYAEGLQVVLIIDEAQDLSVDALEQVRLLTNLETDTQKLLQVILLGQPELRDMLARPELRQLSQRITARFHLTPLDTDETGLYLRHRYAIAGGRHLPFTAAAIRRLHSLSSGVPRLINVIAERALLAGYALDETRLGPRLVSRAARETLPAPTSRAPPASTAWLAAGVLAVLLVAAAWLSQAPGPATSTAQANTTGPAAPAQRARSPEPIPKQTAATASAAPAVAGSAATMAIASTPVERLDAGALAERIRNADPSPLPAWRGLLALWKLAEDVDPAAASACPLSLAPALHCTRGLARLDTLAMMGRPAVLHLRRDGHEAWALLLGLDAVDARVQLDGARFDVDRIALQDAWSGEYGALWGAAPEFEAPLSPGASGPAVDWVGRRLFPETAADGAIVDAEMLAAARAFQRRHGLAADGVIGPETLMALAVGDDGPHLQRVVE